MASFKLYFSADDIRRIRSPKEKPTWAEFNSLLQDLYTNYHPELRVQYLDEEGDRITIGSETEWVTALEVLAKSNPIKLFIQEGASAGAYFKDGPAPVPLAFYDAKTSAPVPVSKDDKTLPKLEKGVPACLAALFKGGKILPYNLPEFLRGCVKLIPLPHNEVDIDVNVFLLYETIHKHAMKCLDSKDPAVLTEGRNALRALVHLSGDNPLVYYNLACAEALIGNKEAAIKALLHSVNECGYQNLEHMEKDSDLDSIRSTEAYASIVDILKKKSGKFEPKPAVIEKPFAPVASEPIPSAPVKEEPAKDSPKEPVKDIKPEPVSEKPAFVPPPAAVLSPLPHPRWQEQLDRLAGMGFNKTELNVALLNKYRGNLQLVLSALLG
eukprot:TRINITY_DN894_c0_g1_i1.p1 TRINITY_DN894_c0_g1~~TRINITY_DN894_c0_g1_i1.p1  ORF type:complete len:382 (+),score=59.65 TRINITY_DN894_c0_g1_i1:56-1201(+)